MQEHHPETAPVVVLGRELTEDGVAGSHVGVPVSEITRHLLITGTTGTGKSVTATHALRTAHTHTDGCTIAIDPKGDWAATLARTHYAAHESLEDVLYFDGGVAVPAISYFDVRRDIAAGRDRLRAVQAITNHFIDLVEQLTPPSHTAIRAPDVIRYLITALFDPAHGSDAFTITDLIHAVQALRRDETYPDVSTEWAETLLEGVTDSRPARRDQIIGGAITRVEKIYGSGYLRPMFTHTPDDPDAAFSFSDFLNTNTLIIFDISGLSAHGQIVLTNAVLSLLWRAIQRRGTPPTTTNGPDSHPRVVLGIDEVPQLGVESRLDELLALGRGFGLGVISLMQYPAQLQAATNGGGDAYEAILNNSHSILAGRVPEDTGLVGRLTTSRHSREELASQLTSLRLDRWLFSPAIPRGAGSVRTHMIADAALPAGHPDASETALDDAAVTRAIAACQQRTATQYGVSHDAYTAAATTDDGATDGEAASPDAQPAPDQSPPPTPGRSAGYQTTLPFNPELPSAATYNRDANAIECCACQNRYPPTLAGLEDAVNCHDDWDAVPRGSIPPVALQLTLTPEERQASPLTVRQLAFLQLVSNCRHDQYTPAEFSLIEDSMTALEEVIGIENSAVTELVDAGVLRIDQYRGDASRASHGWKDYPHRLYTLTPAGRDAIKTPHRQGTDWGHGIADQHETTSHKLQVRVLEAYLTQEYAKDAGSPVTRVEPYYEHDGVRFDVVGLTDADDLHVIGEAERVTGSLHVDAPADYDKIAQADPAAAIWVVMTRKVGHHDVLPALADPHEGAPRIPPEAVTEYTENTPFKDRPLNEPGLTHLYTLGSLRNSLPDTPA